MRYVGTSPPLNNMVKICRNSGFFFLEDFQGKRIRQQCRHCHINTGSYYSDQYCNSICPEYICSIIPDKLIGMNTELFWKKGISISNQSNFSEVIDDINNKDKRQYNTDCNQYHDRMCQSFKSFCTFASNHFLPPRTLHFQGLICAQPHLPAVHRQIRQWTDKSLPLKPFRYFRTEAVPCIHKYRLHWWYHKADRNFV